MAHTPRIFLHEGHPHRIIARTEYVPERGYIEPSEHLYNLLQKRTFGPFGIPLGWRTVDREEVPSHVAIAIGCIGFDTSGWKSRLPAAGFAR